jgi:hypothetical protein
MSVFHCHINGFDVESAIPLPCDPECRSGDPADTLAPLQIRRGTLSTYRQEAATRLGGGGVESYEVGDGILLSAGDCLRLHISRDGKTVTVDAPDAALRIAGTYVVGPALAFCTLLQGDVPLHAAGAEIEGKRIGLLAPSGTGKTTTLWALLDSGALFANDDMIPVRRGARSTTATASVSLYPKADAVRAAEGTGAEEVLPGSGKYWYPLSPACRAPGSRPLSCLFVLQPGEADGEQAVRFDEADGSAAIRLVLKNLFAPRTTAALIGADRLLDAAAVVARTVPVVAVRYPRRLDILPTLAAAIWAAIR